MLRRLFRRGQQTSTQITDLDHNDLKNQQQTSNPKVREDVNIKIHQNGGEHFRLDSLAIMDHKDSEITSKDEQSSNVQIISRDEQSSNVQMISRDEQSSNVQMISRDEQSSNVQIISRDEQSSNNVQRPKDDLDVFMDKLVRESDQTREKIRDISYETHKKMEYESQRIRDAIDRLCDRINDKWPNIGICCGCIE